MSERRHRLDIERGLAMSWAECARREFWALNAAARGPVGFRDLRNDFLQLHIGLRNAKEVPAELGRLYPDLQRAAHRLIARRRGAWLRVKAAAREAML